MKDKANYIIVSAIGENKLGMLVDEKIEEGFMPHGSAYNHGRRHYQPLIHSTANYENRN